MFSLSRILPVSVGARLADRARRWRQSVRFTPSFWYASMLAVVLCLFSVVLYLSVAFSLARDADETLVLQADGAAKSVFAFWRAERASAGSGPGNWSTAPLDTFTEELAQGQSTTLFSRWAEKTQYLNTERPLRLLDISGQVLEASSSFIQFALPVSKSAVAQSRRGGNVYETVRLPGRRIRLFTHAVREGGQVLYLIQAAMDLKEQDASLMRLRLLLLLLVPTTLLAVGAVGGVLAKTALRPIRQLVAQIQDFAAEHLHERVEAPQRPDEVERLSLAFNEMLGRLDRAFRRLRQFSAAAAHEQRTALTVMKGELEVTLRKPRNAEEYRDLLAKHLGTINEIVQAAEQLLRFAQWEAAEESLQRHPVELGELARRTAADFQPLAEQKSVRLEAAIHGPVWVQGELRLLERVVANLLDNAIKHTPEARLVRLLVEPRGDQACLVVEDTGHGIPPDELPGIFDRFFKRQWTSNGTDSIGLGLGLCRWIVESHRGRIEVRSAPDQGATFTVSLPLLPAPSR